MYQLKTTSEQKWKTTFHRFSRSELYLNVIHKSIQII